MPKGVLGFWGFGVLEVKLKFQDKFYDIIDHNKCPSSEKSAEKCVLRKSNFHQILPSYNAMTAWMLWQLECFDSNLAT